MWGAAGADGVQLSVVAAILYYNTDISYYSSLFKVQITMQFFWCSLERCVAFPNSLSIVYTQFMFLYSIYGRYFKSDDLFCIFHCFLFF